jgi:hypothetical protein
MKRKLLMYSRSPRTRLSGSISVIAEFSKFQQIREKVRVNTADMSDRHFEKAEEIAGHFIDANESCIPAALTPVSNSDIAIVDKRAKKSEAQGSESRTRGSRRHQQQLVCAEGRSLHQNGSRVRKKQCLFLSTTALQLCDPALVAA